MYKKFKTLDIEDKVLSRVQDNVEQAIGQLPITEILQGRLVTGIAIVTGTPKVISHKLGKKLQGWIVCRQSASAIIWDSQAASTTTALTLVLNSSANVTVDLWVF